MLSNMDIQILKELDKHKIKSNVISIVMKKLDTEDKKNKFFAYLMKNRGIILDKFDIIENLKILLESNE